MGAEKSVKNLSSGEQECVMDVNSIKLILVAKL